MPLVKIEHPAVGPQRTRLSDGVSASDSSSSVENNNGFATNDYVLFGNLGQEKTEIVLLTGTSGNGTISHSTGPVFDHPRRTPITEIKYNQVEISSASTEDGSYSVLTTIDLTPDEPYTYYDDTNGTSSTWYKVRYYNETTTIYSSYSDAVQGSGYTSNSLRAMTDEVLSDFGDPLGEEISRHQVRRWLRAGVRRLSMKLITVFPDYRRQYTTQDLTADTATYDLPSRFLSFQRVDVNYDGTTYANAYKVQIFEDEASGFPDTNYSKQDPRIFFRADQFGLRPTPGTTGGRAWLWYWDYPSEMTDETDTHGLPHGANEYLISYAIYRAWLTKDQERALGYRADLQEIEDEYTTFISTSRQGYSNNRVQIQFGHDMYEDEVWR